MRKRFYSHYTFIFPNTYLKNVVVELDELHDVKRIFPFEKEIENTEFHSGILFFLPKDIGLDSLNKYDKEKYKIIINEYFINDIFSCRVYNEDGIEVG